MPFWTFGSVEEEPSVWLSSWKIVEVDSGTRHFVGADVYDGSGRVSSAIVTFDLAAKRGITRSSRVYNLISEPGNSWNADYVWKRWCETNEVRSFVDVTQEMLAVDGNAGASSEED
jgi:hypothetical protein